MQTKKARLGESSLTGRAYVSPAWKVLEGNAFEMTGRVRYDVTDDLRRLEEAILAGAGAALVQAAVREQRPEIASWLRDHLPIRRIASKEAR